MDVLHEFLDKQKKEGDSVVRAAPTLLELTRPDSGLYLRIILMGENRYNLQVVQDGGARPKTKWFERDYKESKNLSRGEIRAKCEKVLNRGGP